MIVFKQKIAQERKIESKWRNDEILIQFSIDIFHRATKALWFAIHRVCICVDVQNLGTAIICEWYIQ